MSIRNLILCLVVAVLLTPILTQAHDKLYDSGANNQQLQLRLKRYQGDLDKLKAQIAGLKNTIKGGRASSSVALSSVEETIANERDILSDIQSYLILPFNYSLCHCYSFSSQQKQKLNTDLEQIRSALGRVSADPALQLKCQLSSEVGA